MGTNRLWLIGTFVLIVLMLAGTYFIGVAPQLGAAALAAAETTTVRAQNVGHQQQLDALKEQFENIDSLRSDLEDLRLEVPGEPDQTPLLAQIGALATANEVSVGGIAFETPVLYVPGDSTDPEVVAAAASVSSGNFYVIPVTMTVTGTGEHTFAFLTQLQTGTRLFLVYELGILGTDDDPTTDGVQLEISGQIFVLTAGQLAATPDEVTVTPGEETVIPG